MRSRCDHSCQVSLDIIPITIWPCLLVIVLFSLDCNPAYALSYIMDKKALEQAFYMDIEALPGKIQNTIWVDNATVALDGDWNTWELAPYPVHMDGALYYALIFEDQSVLISQVQANAPSSHPDHNLPIPESPTLVLLGLGLLGVGAFIRCETAKKVRKLS